MKPLAVRFLSKWRYYGFTKERLGKCGAAINAHNARSLTIVSIVTALLMLLLSRYPGGDGHIPGVYYLFTLLQLIVFAYSRILAIRGTDGSAWKYLLGIVFFTINILLFCLYILIFDRGMYTVRFLIFFMSLEVVFIYGSLLSLVYNISLVLLFYIAYAYFERLFGVALPENSEFDIINIASASLIAMTFNWYISRVFISGLITSYSLEEERNRYHEESIHDQLTGLNNRRSFEQSVDFYTSVCRHVHQTVCVVMMDIDFFKKYNDFYGHQKGDTVLQTVGGVLKRLMVEEKVYAARVCGEEFIILWTENRTAEAERVVLKLRQMIIDMGIPHEKSEAAAVVTASLGLYIMRGGSEDSATELYNAADSALYRAKAAGRNCVVVRDSSDDSYRQVELRDYTAAGR